MDFSNLSASDAMMRDPSSGKTLQHLAFACLLGICLVGGYCMDARANAASGAGAGDAAGATFTVKLPLDQPVAYRGAANFDGAGVGGTEMLYPAPNAAGLLVAIFTHGALVESAKNAQRTQLQEAADKVLDPFRADLGDFVHARLLDRGMKKIAVPGRHRQISFDDDGAQRADWMIESAPIFSLGQDRDVLVLDNTVSVRGRENPQKLTHQTVVKVVWNLRDPGAAVDYWGAEQAERLKEVSARLFAHSLELLLDHLILQPAGSAEAPQKTYRYPEGKAERMERGTLVSAQCDRVVIKTLRGWLMSIPVQLPSGVDPSVPACADLLGSP